MDTQLKHAILGLILVGTGLAKVFASDRLVAELLSRDSHRIDRALAEIRKLDNAKKNQLAADLTPIVKTGQLPDIRMAMVGIRLIGAVPNTKRLIPDFLFLIRSKDDTMRGASSELLGELGKQDETVVLELKKILELYSSGSQYVESEDEHLVASTDPETNFANVRSSVLDALSKIGSEEAVAILKNHREPEQSGE